MTEAAGWIGPNAVTQLAAALGAAGDITVRDTVFRHAGCQHYLTDPPEHPVDENDVAALHRSLRAATDPARARAIAAEAGLRTGDYVLRNRIPGFARTIVRALPPALASRALSAAIARHAWTFAGTGRFAAVAGHPLVFSIAGCPLCRGTHAEGPSCDFYAATFQYLFAALVHPNARAIETECEAAGGTACRFTICWSSHR